MTGASPLRVDRVLSPSATEPVPVSSLRVTPAWRSETIGCATLYLGDCREVLPTLQGAQLVCTDPPYLVSKGGFAANLQLEGGFGGWMKDYGNQGDIVPCDIEFSEWMPLVFAALAERAQGYFMTNGRNVRLMQGAAEDAGFRFHTLLVWDKRAALPNKYYQNVTEFGLFMFKGKARTINDPGSKNLVSIFQRDETAHPTEKPVELMRFWIGNSSAPGDVVLDPFMGSGSTGVAAIQTGRSFVGIEQDERWFDVACQRIADAQAQGDLFVPAQVDTHPKGGDSLLAPFMGSAVGCKPMRPDSYPTDIPHTPEKG